MASNIVSCSGAALSNTIVTDIVEEENSNGYLKLNKSSLRRSVERSMDVMGCGSVLPIAVCRRIKFAPLIYFEHNAPCDYLMVHSQPSQFLLLGRSGVKNDDKLTAINSSSISLKRIINVRSSCKTSESFHLLGQYKGHRVASSVFQGNGAMSRESKNVETQKSFLLQTSNFGKEKFFCRGLEITAPTGALCGLNGICRPVAYLATELKAIAVYPQREGDLKGLLSRNEYGCYRESLRWDEQEFVRLIIQLCNIIESLHVSPKAVNSHGRTSHLSKGTGLVHSDIKLENFVFEATPKGSSIDGSKYSFSVELTDFEGVVNEGTPCINRASPGYMSPEHHAALQSPVAKRHRWNHKQQESAEDSTMTNSSCYLANRADDAWALGETIRRLVNELQSGFLSSHLAPLISGLMCSARKDRWSVPQAADWLKRFAADILHMAILPSGDHPRVDPPLINLPIPCKDPSRQEHNYNMGLFSNHNRKEKADRRRPYTKIVHAVLFSPKSAPSMLERMTSRGGTEKYSLLLESATLVDLSSDESDAILNGVCGCVQAEPMKHYSSTGRTITNHRVSSASPSPIGSTSAGSSCIFNDLIDVSVSDHIAKSPLTSIMMPGDNQCTIMSDIAF